MLKRIRKIFLLCQVLLQKDIILSFNCSTNQLVNLLDISLLKNSSFLLRISSRNVTEETLNRKLYFLCQVFHSAKLYWMQRCSIQLLLENVSGITCKEEIFVSVLSINFCFCLSVRPRKKDFLINFLFGFFFTQNFKICKGILWVDLRK